MAAAASLARAAFLILDGWAALDGPILDPAVREVVEDLDALSARLAGRHRAAIADDAVDDRWLGRLPALPVRQTALLGAYSFSMADRGKLTVYVGDELKDAYLSEAPDEFNLSQFVRQALREQIAEWRGERRGAPEPR